MRLLTVAPLLLLASCASAQPREFEGPRDLRQGAYVPY
jgi:hypothetical protein